MSSSDEERETPKALGTMSVIDAKEVIVSGNRSSYLISHKALDVHPSGTYLKLQPDRYRPISKLLASRCDKTMRKKIATKSRFWTGKHEEGKKFLDRLRGYKMAAMKRQFDIKPHNTSRQKVRRPRLPDTVQVRLPGMVGGAAGTATMLVNTSTHGDFLSFELNPFVLNHLTIMAREFFSVDPCAFGSSDADPNQDDAGSTQNPRIWRLG